MENIENSENAVKQGSCGCGCECSAPAAEKTEATENAAPRRTYIPAVDIVDSGTETVVVADLPGVDETTLDITVEKNILTVAAKQSEQAAQGRKLIYSEYGVGDYRRSFTLSEDVDRDGISAALRDGVLTIRLPKAAPVARKIAIASN